jgi:Protein of unknown function (DUF2865)
VRWRRTVQSISRTAVGFAVLFVALFAAAPDAARAEGFLDFIFGGQQERPAPPSAPVNTSVPPPVRAAPPPLGHETLHRGSGSTGHSVAFCVRLCDGKGFPMERHANAAPVETCQALCPASKTKVYFGTEIDGSVARDGTHYAGLENAFLYRKQLVANCTCNGRDAFGLAPFDMTSDPTLRPGDIVVTNNGLMAYTGKPGPTGAFTPVDPASISAQLNSITSPQRVSARAERTDLQPPVPTVAQTPDAQTQSAAPQDAQPQDLPTVVDARDQDGR